MLNKLGGYYYTIMMDGAAPEEAPAIQHPLDPSLLPANVKVFPRKNGGWSYIIGTAHVSQVSADHVREVIQTVRPDTVVIELCKSRVGLLVQQQKEVCNSELHTHLTTSR
mgnify:CR=1 FL=1